MFTNALFISLNLKNKKMFGRKCYMSYIKVISQNTLLLKTKVEPHSCHGMILKIRTLEKSKLENTMR